MKKFFSIWLWTSLLTSVSVLYAQVSTAIEGEEKLFPLNELLYFIDATNELPIDSIVLPKYQARFLKHDAYQNKDFRPNESYWIRFTVKHIGSHEKDWLVEFYDQTIDHLEAYKPMPDGSYQKVVMGDHYPFKQRTFRHKNFEIPLKAQGDTTLVYYFKVRNHEFADIRIAYRTVDRFIFYSLIEYLLYGMFYGMILIISLYNLLVYVAIREVKNLYYIFYILSVALYAMALDGTGFQFIWSEHPEWNDSSKGIALYLVIFWALIFTRRFLSTRSTSPRLDKILGMMILVRSAYFVVSLLFFPKLFAYAILDILPLSLIFYTSIRVWARGYRPARFFVIAYGILFTGFFLRLLVYFDILPFTILSHYSLHISFMLEMLFLTFALGDRIRILKNNRDRALRRIIHQHEVNMQLKDKVTRELEQKVRERTIELNEKNQELEQSNQKLERQAREINQINSILDLDNWKLKNSIKEVLHERLHEKTMDYNQFKTLYPDMMACYRFLESLKWVEGFRCRKCENEKFFPGAAKFSRRCTRCGYNESITAYTIFHSIKFPIEKAFYIAYLTVTGKKENTLEALASQLGLRVNTVWSFRQKVIERISELESAGWKPSASKWEDIILFVHEVTGGPTASRPKLRSVARK